MPKNVYFYTISNFTWRLISVIFWMACFADHNYRLWSHINTLNYDASLYPGSLSLLPCLLEHFHLLMTTYLHPDFSNQIKQTTSFSKQFWLFPAENSSTKGFFLEIQTTEILLPSFTEKFHHRPHNSSVGTTTIFIAALLF